ncbi:carbohydrate kinase family protein [Micromonospora sp. NPDC092111]|uniref:carbohydrate kinase family protein n=1 Tax=Micromonospora sp. NPDC092111 TaxID=3364289 RepID=UPI003801C456
MTDRSGSGGRGGPARPPGSRTPARIVVVGDVSTDIVAVLSGPLAPGSDTPGTVQVLPGGQGANTAAWLAWLDRPVTFVGAVGDDDAGHARLRELTAMGVTCAVRRCPGTPTGTVVVLTGTGDRTMVSQRGANLRVDARHVAGALADTTDARHLHLSGYALLDEGSRDGGLRALAEARRGGLTTSVDAASAEPLRTAGPENFLRWVGRVDILLANADEAATLTGAPDAVTAARALTLVAENAVVKLGAAGAVWAGSGGAVCRAAAPAVRVVDSTGAGDAFAAGLVAEWVDGAQPVAALRRGGELGAAAVAVVGARPQPTRPEAGARGTRRSPPARPTAGRVR